MRRAAEGSVAGRHVREKRRIHPRGADGRRVELPAGKGEQADARGVRRIEQRRFAPGQRHGAQIVDRAERDRAGRDQAVDRGIKMRDRAVAGGKRVAGRRGEPFGVGLAVAVRQVAAAVLPDRQRSGGPPVGIEIHDAVHLPGEADGGDVPVGRERGRDPVHTGDQCGGVLLLFPRLGRGEERAVLLGDRLHDLPGGHIARNAAQRRRADIQSDKLHEILLSTGRSTAGRAAG